MPKGQYTRRGRPPAAPAEPEEPVASLEPFGGKGDHDGDGKVGGAHPPIDAPQQGGAPSVEALDEGAKFGTFIAEPSAPEPPPPAAPVKLVTVKLLRNYRPAGAVEIVGYHKPAVMIRNVAGKEVEVSPSVFVEGEVAPPPQAGVGFATKLWAGTVIRLPVDEAKRVKANGIGEIEID